MRWSNSASSSILRKRISCSRVRRQLSRPGNGLSNCANAKSSFAGGTRTEFAISRALRSARARRWIDSWRQLVKKRSAKVLRNTGETQIALVLTIDGTGNADVKTGVPFFDHMLTLLAKHSLCDLKIRATGDLDVDTHHLVEDVGIALGQAFVQALGNKPGIRRYGWAIVPMDEALAQC